MIRGACAHVKTRMRPRYVDRKKVAADLFERYFAAIEMYLRARFDGMGEGDLSLFASMERVDPSMTQKEYRRNHRSRVEYLARKTTEQVRKGLRQEGAGPGAGRPT